MVVRLFSKPLKNISIFVRMGNWVVNVKILFTLYMKMFFWLSSYEYLWNKYYLLFLFC